MSQNNQTLIKEYKGKYLVFENINAESWCFYDKETGQWDDDDFRDNELPLSRAEIFTTNNGAYQFAHLLEDKDPTEYGVHLNTLAKDGSEVKIIE